MKKKLMIMLMVLAMTFFMAACGTADDEAANDQETETTAAVEEDGQNPVMNIVGPWADKTSGRASMEIECEGTDGAAITIHWANGAASSREWEFHGTFDTETNVVTYENGVCKDVTYDEDENESTETVYEDGTGTFTVNDDNTITWQDDKEDAGADCVFEFAG